MGEYEDMIEVGNAVLTGSKADDYFKNSSGCFSRYVTWTFYDAPPYIDKYYDASRSFTEKLDDFTNITKVATNHLWVCTDMA